MIACLILEKILFKKRSLYQLRIFKIEAINQTCFSYTRQAFTREIDKIFCIFWQTKPFIKLQDFITTPFQSKKPINTLMFQANGSWIPIPSQCYWNNIFSLNQLLNNSFKEIQNHFEKFDKFLILVAVVVSRLIIIQQSCFISLINKVQIKLTREIFFHLFDFK